MLTAVGLLWVGVAAYTLLSRALYDFRQLAFIGARRFARSERGIHALPRRTLAGIASDAHAEPGVAAAAARELLGRRRSSRLLRRAERHRNEAEKWTRVAAIRVFSLAAHPEAWRLLRQALSDDDADVVGAAVSMLGERTEPEAAALLVQALVEGRYPRSRIATHLERADAQPLLLALSDYADPEVRYWAAAMLRPTSPESELALVSLLGDESATVRAAVAKSFTAAGGPAATDVAVRLLADPVWFVRAQAARLLAATGRAELAERLTPLLRDDEWWVRAAAKHALAELGPDALPVLVDLLRDDDRFARNGAAEVVSRLGVVERWLEDPSKRRLLLDYLEAGEERVQRAELATADAEDRVRLRSMLAELRA